MRARPVAVAALLVCWLFAGGVAFTGTASAATIEVDHTLAQNDAAGEVDVRTGVRVPSGTASLEITLPEGSEVYDARGFSRTGDRTYEWTRSTNRPYLRYSLEGNVTIDRGDGEEYLYAVTDDWAVVRTPSISLSWTGVRADVDVSASVDGEGVGGRHITYLGPYEESTREAPSQRFRLVEAAASDLRPDREAVLDDLEYASERIQIGQKDEEVLVIVVPSANIEWAATGVQRGHANMWVRDAERLDDPKNTWIHEYLHTLQNYDRRAETRWTIEGMADYYAALITYERGHIDYEEFRDRMADGRDDDLSGVELDDPATWKNNRGNYDKGGLVFGHLDRRLRAEHGTSIDAAIREFNKDGEELTQEAFLDAIEAAGDGDLRADAQRYTETTDTPPVWSRQEHVEAYGGLDFRYRFGSFGVSGPYREASLDEPRVVAGETLSATVTVRNEGNQEGEFRAPLKIDGETVDTESGTLGPDEATTVTFEHTFEDAGEYELAVGSASTTAVVEEPADVEVTGLEVKPTAAAMDERVTLRATVESAADRPAVGEVAFAVDGESVGTEPVRVADGAATVETTTTFDSPGEHEVTAGGRSATVTVTDETATASPTGTATATVAEDSQTPSMDDGPGPGALPAAAALVVASFLLRRRR